MRGLRIIRRGRHMADAVPKAHSLEDVGSELGAIIRDERGGYTKVLKQMGTEHLHSELSSGAPKGENPTKLGEGIHANKQEFVPRLATRERPNIVNEDLLQWFLRHLRG